MNAATKNLVSQYRKTKPLIKKRLAEFKHLRKARNEDIFSELCYCILTANANALLCDKAIKELQAKDLLLEGSAMQIRPALKGKARFHNKKARFIVTARNVFRCDGSIDIKRHLEGRDIIDTRDWLVKNIKGFGYKESSHFLRNIGLGKDIAILDRHILKNLKKYGVINKVPSSIGNRTSYIEIEDRMRRFAKKVNVPLEELDLLLWSIETGFIFK